LASLLFVSDSRIHTKRQHSHYYGSAATASVKGVPFEVSITAGETRQTVGESELPPAPTPVGDLVAAMRDQKRIEMSAEMAVHIVEVVQAAYRSAREQRSVTI
jgi:hypothetical protein